MCAFLLAFIQLPLVDGEVAGAALAAFAMLLKAGHCSDIPVRSWFPLAAPALRLEAVVNAASQLCANTLMVVHYTAWNRRETGGLSAAAQEQLTNAAEPPLDHLSALICEIAAPFAMQLVEQATNVQGQWHFSERCNQAIFVTRVVSVTMMPALDLGGSRVPVHNTAAASDIASRTTVPVQMSAKAASDLVRLLVSLSRLLVVPMRQLEAAGANPASREHFGRIVVSLFAAAIRASRFLAASHSHGQHYETADVEAGVTAGALTGAEGTAFFEVLCIVLHPKVCTSWLSLPEAVEVLREAAEQPGSPLTAAADVVKPGLLAAVHSTMGRVCVAMRQEKAETRQQAGQLLLLHAQTQVFQSILKGTPSIAAGPPLAPAHLCAKDCMHRDVVLRGLLLRHINMSKLL